MSETYTIVFHPSLITYDYKKVYNWGAYLKRKKHNQNVKEFRRITGYTEHKPTYDDVRQAFQNNTLNVIEMMFWRPGDFWAWKNDVFTNNSQEWENNVEDVEYT